MRNSSSVLFRTACRSNVCCRQPRLHFYCFWLSSPRAFQSPSLSFFAVFSFRTSSPSSFVFLAFLFDFLFRIAVGHHVLLSHFYNFCFRSASTALMFFCCMPSLFQLSTRIYPRCDFTALFFSLCFSHFNLTPAHAYLVPPNYYFAISFP